MQMIHTELQLGLALPSITDVKELDFDLNSYYVYEPKDPSSWNNNHFGSSGSVPSNNDKKKRSFDDVFEQVKPVPHRTLPLFNWNKQPDDEDHPKDLDNNSSIDSNMTSDEDGVVGWPPIKNWRKKLCYEQYHGSSMYVKVKMEGVAIARKIDISLYNSFETLTNTLISMFSLWHEDSHNYQLSYQDREGDWLIAQDVSWRTFIRSVQRLKLCNKSIC